MEKSSQILRQAREQQHITLEEAAQKTRIPLFYLMALEGNDPDSRHHIRFLPDPMYLIPHLRRYAAFLDIDAHFVVTQFTNELQDLHERNHKFAAGKPPPQTLGPSPQRSRALSLSIILASVLVTLALIGQYSDLRTKAPSGGEESMDVPFPSPLETQPQAAPLSPAAAPSASTEPSRTSSAPVQPSLANQRSSAAPPTSTSPAASLSAGAAPRSQPDSTLAKTPQSGAAPLTSAALVESPAGRSSHLLQASAKEATWIRVLIDGQSPKEMILQPGQSASWSADSIFVLTLGNAGGVTLTIDGQELPPLGKSGQVLRNIRLPFSSTEAYSGFPNTAKNKESPGFP